MKPDFATVTVTVPDAVNPLIPRVYVEPERERLTLVMLWPVTLWVTVMSLAARLAICWLKARVNCVVRLLDPFAVRLLKVTVVA